MEKVGIMNHAYEQTQEELAMRLRETLPHLTVAQVDFPASLAAYLGPNMVGVVVYEGAY